MDLTSLLLPGRSLLALALLGLGACDRRPASPDRPEPAAPASVAPRSPAAASPAPAAGSGSPLSRLTPPARPGPRPLCPLAIDPGVSFGPVSLGETLADLTRAGLAVTNVSDLHAEIALPGAAPDAGPASKLDVELCQGKIVGISLEDLRVAPECVTLAGKPVGRATSREDLERSLGPCTDTPVRTGGTFEKCAGGGVYVGHGMGDFLQIRVRPRSIDLDDTCAMASDDGSPIELSAEQRVAMLSQTLNLAALGSYWHVDRPGRDPLRIPKTPLVPATERMMFGSPVVWIEPEAAKPGTAYFVVTKLEASKTRATLTFAYPIEGVVGTARFINRYNGWTLDKGEVHER